MCLVGFHFLELTAALVIEIQYQFRVSSEALRGGYFIDIVAFPEASCITKGANAAFGTDTRTGEYN